MQKVKIVLRVVGTPSAGLGVVSGEEAGKTIEEKYTSDGYVIQNSFYVGDVKDANGNVLGYKLMFVLVKDEELKATKAKNA